LHRLAVSSAAKSTAPQIDVVRAGGCRVKRVVYRPGFRWSTHMKPIVGTDLCMHALVGS
jgi:hypothetical protein